MIFNNWSLKRLKLSALAISIFLIEIKYKYTLYFGKDF